MPGTGDTSRTSSACILVRGGTDEDTGKILTAAAVAERVSWCVALVSGIAAGLLECHWNAADMMTPASGTGPDDRPLPARAWVALRRLGWNATAPDGHIVVPDPVHQMIGRAAVYARVSTRKQKADLGRQAERMTAFANAAGLSMVTVVKETASGVDDSRPRLAALPKDGSWGTPVIEHKDRLSRVGFGWFEVLLAARGKQVIVADAATEETADLMDDFASVACSFTARLYGPRPTRRRAEQAVAALKAGSA
jgi:predicted site-specific integrase-resolvase